MAEEIKDEIQPEEALDLKVCKKCGNEKPLSEFNRNKKSPDGYRQVCKECAKMAKKPNLIGRICKKLGLTEEQAIIVLILIETVLIIFELIKR